MKRILLSLILTCISLCIYSQEHLSFKGIAIEGSMDSFLSKLKAKGFNIISQKNSISILTGVFTGREANIGVSSTDDGSTVYSVSVFFDESKDWNTLVTTYEYYKNLYSRKYGEPYLCKEYNPGHDSNISKMDELQQGNATYISGWDVTGGSIYITISKTEYLRGNVVVVYKDAQSENLRLQMELENI